MDKYIWFLNKCASGISQKHGNNLINNVSTQYERSTTIVFEAMPFAE